MAGNMIGKVFNGRYSITERIGIGGMAEVYRAQDNVLGRTVAIKVMLPQYASDPSFTQRFRQEASSAANLQSPYIVNVYDWGQDQDNYFIVMEYVRGSDLKAAIMTRGAINERKVAQIGSQVCQALSVAHHLDIIHRDIKPQNIMVQPDGNIKVMDFGIASAKNSIKTQTSSVLGTAHYLSPEQAQGKPLTATSDIYSLGVVMYEAVTGQLPFNGETAVEVAMKQVRDEPIPPRQINPEVSPAMESIILRAMNKDPHQRFATALEMRQVLNDFLAGRMRATFANAPTNVMAAAVPVSGSKTTVMPAVDSSVAKNYSSSNTGNYKAVSDDKTNKKGGKGKVIGIVIAAIAAIAIIAFAVTSMGNSTSVPDVTGMDQAKAEQTLKNAGYTIGAVTEVYDEKVASGKVVSTDPTAGTKADKGTIVKLTVSKGNEKVTVPDLKGMTEAEAQRALTQKGLTAMAGAQEYSDTVESGNVCRQDTTAGTTVEKGSTVTYYISKGSEKVEVPNVTNYSQEQAIQRIQQAGLQYELLSPQYSESVKAGYVIYQDETAGSKVAKGTVVGICVSQGYEPSSSSSSGKSSSSSSGSSSSTSY